VKNHAKTILTYVAGWSFILLGIVGLFLPILQGILFIAIGLLILAQHSRWAKRMLVRLRRKYPEQYKGFETFRQKVSSLFKK